jgi:ribosomal protein S9
MDPNAAAASLINDALQGGHTSQIYAIRQATAKALIAWYQKCKHIP